jgi:conjugal transfer mating pair stabilization protein TraG
MEFTIYTFGDVETFRAALAGVAMIFNADGFFVSNSGIGLGSLAGLGLLIGLVGILVNGIITQKVDIGGFIVLVIVFSILFVPKFSVNVEDYNGEAIAKVDNVPLGVALPAGLISGLARELNIKLGTAFSTVDGYPSGLMTPQALTSPLRLLLSLRAAATIAPDREPRLTENLFNLIAYCSAGRGKNNREWGSLPLGRDPILSTVAEAGAARGLTLFSASNNADASLVTCESAATQIAADFEALDESSRLVQIVTAAATRSGAAGVRVANGVATVQDVSPEAQAEALRMVGQISDQGTRAFVRFAMFAPTVTGAYVCAGTSGDPTAWALCLNERGAFNAWSEDAAASGTFFQRIMFQGMNALFFVWICLSPIVAVMMLMMGLKGLRLAGSYLLFGAWTVSWYVGASIVNFYMLKQLQYQTSMLGSLDTLNLSTFGEFFGVLQRTLGLAGDMMASVPLIMMTVMSGSVYGMVQLASRWGSKDYYDEKAHNPAAVASSPMLAMQTGMQRTWGAASSFDTRLGHGADFNMQSSASVAGSLAVKEETLSSQSWNKGVKQIADGIRNGSVTSGQLTSWADTLEKNNAKEQAQAVRAAAANVATHSNSTAVRKSAAASVEAAVTAKTPSLLPVGASVTAKGSVSIEGSKTADDTNSQSTTRSNETSATDTSRQSSGWHRSTGGHLARESAAIFSRTDQTDLARSFTESEQHSESAQTMRELRQQFGSQASFSDEAAVNRLAASAPALAALAEASTRYEKRGVLDPVGRTFHDAYESAVASGQALDRDARALYARAQALQAVALTGDEEGMRAWVGVAAPALGAKPPIMTPPTSVRVGGFAGAGAPAREASGVTGAPADIDKRIAAVLKTKGARK